MSRELKGLPPLTDTDQMPSGKHKGELMQDVPAEYLRYIYDNDLCSQRVKQYITENLEIIDLEIKRSQL